jgi:hypothetical protein
MSEIRLSRGVGVPRHRAARVAERRHDGVALREQLDLDVVRPRNEDDDQRGQREHERERAARQQLVPPDRAVDEPDVIGDLLDVEERFAFGLGIRIGRLGRGRGMLKRRRRWRVHDHRLGRDHARLDRMRTRSDERRHPVLVVSLGLP